MFPSAGNRHPEAPSDMGRPDERHVVRGELGDVPTERLEHEIAELAAHLTAGTCRWLELVAEFDRREGWGSWGCRSCAEWISWQCAVAPRAAREHVRVARCLRELPMIHAAFSRGELSYSKVRALTRVASRESEEELLELANHATAAQLERIVKGLRYVTADEAERAYLDRYLVHYWEDDGSLSIHARIPAEDGAVVLEALEAARDALWDAQRERDRGSAEPEGAESGALGGSAEPPIPYRIGPTNADALVEIAERSLAGGSGRRSGGDRYQVVLHVDAAGKTPPALEDGPAVSAETARRVACDASVVPMTEANGEPLSVGRKRRTIPPSMRRALEARGRGCSFPGCENTRFVDAHHIHHWADGGETGVENLLLLCRHHHRLVHEGGFRAVRAPNGEPRFARPDGTVIPGVPSPIRGDPDVVPWRNRSAGLAVDRDTSATGSGEPLDLHHAVGVLAARVT
jgi:Domain of unknown function (DUF222)/HNH endonuclease